MRAPAERYRKTGKGAQTPQNARRAAETPKPTPNPSRPEKTPQEPISGPTEAGQSPGRNPPLAISLVLNHEHEFLARRGVTPEQAASFGIGHVRTGIMKNRIAVPIHNLAGELVAYTGRYAADDVPKGEIKYKLPKGFEKSLELYNIHRAAALGKTYVVIVEGVWSVLRLHAAGVPAVALLGVSVSQAQAKLVKTAGFRHAVLILDGDDAGRSATPAALTTLAERVYVKTILLPDGEKPDTMSHDIVRRLVR
jgi:DNA primase